MISEASPLFIIKLCVVFPILSCLAHLLSSIVYLPDNTSSPAVMLYPVDILSANNVMSTLSSLCRSTRILYLPLRWDCLQVIPGHNITPLLHQSSNTGWTSYPAIQSLNELRSILFPTPLICTWDADCWLNLGNYLSFLGFFCILFIYVFIL